MGDLRRERDTARNERDANRRLITALQAILGDIDPTYADAYATLCDIAHHGTKADNPKLSSAFESQPPKHNPAAYHLRNEERRHQRARAQRLLAHIERIADGHPTVVGTTDNTLSAQPSGNGGSSRPVVVRFSQWSSCAPEAPQTTPTPTPQGA
jgi:hypothetical protein